MATILTKSELAIVRLVAWGAAEKDIPDLLPHSLRTGKPVSISTVKNHLDNARQKTGVRSLNGFSAWYFHHYLNVGLENCPNILKKRITTGVLLIVLLIGAYSNLADNKRQFNSTRLITRSVRTSSRARSSRKEFNYIL